jgi:hypothetical protein
MSARFTIPSVVSISAAVTDMNVMTGILGDPLQNLIMVQPFSRDLYL